MDDFEFNFPWWRVSIISAIVLVVLFFGGWLLDINVVQPMNRQTIDNNAARQIAVNHHFHQLLADIQTAQTQLTNDEQALTTFKQDHPGKLSYQDNEQLSQLENNITQDKLTLQADCNQYNSDMSNPDWKGADASLPRYVTP